MQVQSHSDVLRHHKRALGGIRTVFSSPGHGPKPGPTCAKASQFVKVDSCNCGQNVATVRPRERCDNAAVASDDSRSIPDLRGAACRGQPELFDAANRHDPRIEAAQAVCRGCPVLAECQRWLSSLPPQLRPRGVVAGVYVAPPRSPAPAGYSMRVCAECGRGFAAKRSDAQYCSAVCRDVRVPGTAQNGVLSSTLSHAPIPARFSPCSPWVWRGRAPRRPRRSTARQCHRSAKRWCTR
jgi:hypothetical protein